MLTSSSSPQDPVPVDANAPVTTLADLPLLLDLKQIASIYRISVATIYRDLANGSFRPAPYKRNPYRWRRVDVERDLDSRTAYAAAPRRAPKARRVSAARRARAKK